MGILGSMLRAGLSTAATIAAAFGARSIDSAAPFAPTPRKPGFKVKRKLPTALRAKARADAENRFYKQLSKEREIGVDPIHLHGSSLRKEVMRPEWLKKSKAWDRANG